MIFLFDILGEIYEKIHINNNFCNFIIKWDKYNCIIGKSK